MGVAGSSGSNRAPASGHPGGGAGGRGLARADDPVAAAGRTAATARNTPSRTASAAELRRRMTGARILPTAPAAPASQPARGEADPVVRLGHEVTVDGVGDA